MQNDKSKIKEEFKRRVYKFAFEIIGFVERLPKGQVSNIIGDQLIRSSTSIGANVVEAKSSASSKDYINFFTHALKSANETKFWLALLRDSNKAEKELTNKLIREATELSNILASSILTLKGKR
ncbi:MAG: four helix bundle protein [Dehalococcoidia bacterium]|nr:four helix bundle protein [Dehalococcoidia bacterium]